MPSEDKRNDDDQDDVLILPARKEPIPSDPKLARLQVCWAAHDFLLSAAVHWSCACKGEAFTDGGGAGDGAVSSVVLPGELERLTRRVAELGWEPETVNEVSEAVRAMTKARAEIDDAARQLGCRGLGEDGVRKVAQRVAEAKADGVMVFLRAGEALEKCCLPVCGEVLRLSAQRGASYEWPMVPLCVEAKDWAGYEREVRAHWWRMWAGFWDARAVLEAECAAFGGEPAAFRERMGSARLKVLADDAPAPVQAPDPETHMTDTQKRVWRALEEAKRQEDRGLTGEELAARLRRDRSTVLRATKPLREEGLLANERGIGYYRTDLPRPRPTLGR